MKTVTFATCILAIGVAAGIVVRDRTEATETSPSWSGKAAAGYLDQRMVWWMGWKNAQRDHGTFCVSCHTVLPYALGRPALRAALGEQAPSDPEKQLLDNVTKRVRLWKEVAPRVCERREKGGGIARHGVRAQRRHHGELRRGRRHAQPRYADGAGQHVGRATEVGRCPRSVAAGCNFTTRRGRATRNITEPRWRRWRWAARPATISPSRRFEAT